MLYFKLLWQFVNKILSLPFAHGTRQPGMIAVEWERHDWYIVVG